MKYFNYLFLLMLFTGCSNHSSPLPNKKLCNYHNLELNSTNNFCAYPRVAETINDQLIIGFDDGNIASWNLKTLQFDKSFETTSRYSIRTLLYHNKKLLAGGQDMKLYQYDLKTKQLLKSSSFSHGTIFSLEQFQNKLYLGCGDSSILHLSKDFKVKNSSKEHNYLIYTLFIDKEKKLLLSGSDDNRVIVWKIEAEHTLTPIKKIAIFKNAVRKIQKVAQNYIVGSADGSLYLFDHSFKLLKQYSLSKGIIVSLSTMENIVLSGDSYGKIIISKQQDNQLKQLKEIQLDSSVRIIQIKNKTAYIVTKDGYFTSISLENFL